MSIITSMNHGCPSQADPTIISFTASGSTATGAAIAGGLTIELCATENCYIAFGAGSPTAASTTHYLPANTIKKITLPEAFYIAARGVINSGSLYISIITF